MTVWLEGELKFTFPDQWKVEQFDRRHRTIPKHVAPVDFVVEREKDLLLIEVKDFSAKQSQLRNQQKDIKKMQTDELTHQELVPKARSTWSYLYLMGLASKPLVYIAVIGTDALSIEPFLLQSLNDRMRKRIFHEVEEPWVKPYVTDSVVIAALDLHKFLTGVSVQRVSQDAR